MFNKNKNKFLPKEYLRSYLPKNLIDREKRGFGWNFNMNKLIFEKIYKDINFETFENYNLNKNFF